MFPTPRIPTQSTRKLLLPMKGKGMISTTLVKSERVYLVWAQVNYQPKAQICRMDGMWTEKHFFIIFLSYIVV
jgi:hypothetical protein